MHGVVMHTMVGQLESAVAWFSNPAAQASAHFGIAQDGRIHQFGPIGKGWVAWAEAAGNYTWYSIEHADNGDPANPLTDAQLTASAQVVECLSAFAGFPLQVTDSVNGRGYGVHVMGGNAWGGHTCPGPGPRAGQRHEVSARAQALRTQPAPQPSAAYQNWTADGRTPLAQAAAAHQTGASTILRLTAEQSPSSVYPQAVATWLDGVFANTVPPTAPVPKGIVLRVPG
jgi:hypothetical protein